MKKQKFNSAIIPVVETEDNGFDEIPFEVEDRQRRKGKKKQLSKSKFLRDTRIKDESAASNNKWRHSLFEWRRTCRNTVDYLDVFLLSQRSRRLGAPFLLLGLILCGILEAIQAHFRYNVTIFLVLSAATLFPSFPKDSVRPQLCISVLTLLTYAMDIYKLSTKFGSRDGIITMVVFVMVCKSFVFNAFLRNATGAPRTRKYLDRRLRLFCVPFKQPKRIMRDVRGRFLALGWIHLFGVIAYVTFLLVFVFYFDYSLLLLSEQSGKMLPIYLLIKSFTTLAILLGILYDTDIILALWYFGCFGFNVSFVRQYIIRKRIELKGWPLAFAYYGLRFYILSFVKAIDVLWGLYGWYLIGSNFIDGFLRVEDSLKVFLTFLMYSMIITDIWCTVLFLSIRWLLKRQKMLRELKMLEVSDDSEIEEFRLRDELEPTISADAMKEQRRQEYRQRYIEEGFEGEPGTLKLAVTRKPSKADKLKTKGKSRIKENTIMPENPSNADIGYSNYEYEYDPEGQVIIYPIGNQSSFDDIYPNDVLDHPDDNIRTGRVDEAINPLLQKPKSTIISRSTSSRAVDVELDNYYDIYDGAGLSEQEMELIQKVGKICNVYQTLFCSLIVFGFLYRLMVLPKGFLRLSFQSYGNYLMLRNASVVCHLSSELRIIS